MNIKSPDSIRSKMYKTLIIFVIIVVGFTFYVIVNYQPDKLSDAERDTALGYILVGYMVAYIVTNSIYVYYHRKIMDALFPLKEA